MDATLKIIDHQAYLDYGGAMFPVGPANYEPDERAAPSPYSMSSNS